MEQRKHFHIPANYIAFSSEICDAHLLMPELRFRAEPITLSKLVIDLFNIFDKPYSSCEQRYVCAGLEDIAEDYTFDFHMVWDLFRYQDLYHATKHRVVLIESAYRLRAAFSNALQADVKDWARKNNPSITPRQIHILIRNWMSYIYYYTVRG